MTTRDISEHIQELYGIELSATAGSQITDKVKEVLTEWKNRIAMRV